VLTLYTGRKVSSACGTCSICMEHVVFASVRISADRSQFMEPGNKASVSAMHFQVIGHLGQVVSLLDSGDVRVLYCGDTIFIINQQALTKVSC
jgi:hypothetical protein